MRVNGKADVTGLRCQGICFMGDAMDVLEDRRYKLSLVVGQLRDAVAASDASPHDTFIRDAVIKRFEMSFELAWKCVRDWLADHHPEVQVFGAKSTLVKGVELGLLVDADLWSEMLRQRNLTVHTYNEKLAIEVSDEVRTMPFGVSMILSAASLEPQALRTKVSPRVLGSLVAAVAWHPRVDRAVIYGSRGRGQPRYWSDIDLAIYGRDMTDEDRHRLAASIEDAAVVYPMDFVFYDSRHTTDALRAAIDRDGIVIYDRTNPPSAATTR